MLPMQDPQIMVDYPRSLQQQQSLSPPPYYSGGGDYISGSQTTTLNVRIAGVFVILSAGLIGGLPPLFLKVFRQPGAPLPRLLRAFAAGLILALACIHVMPDAYSDLGSLQNLMNPAYDPSGVVVVFGIILMVCLQSLTHSYMNHGAKKGDFLQPPAVEAESAAHNQPGTKAGHNQPGTKAGSHHEQHGHGLVQAHMTAHAAHEHLQLPLDATTLVVVPASVVENPGDPHEHACMRSSHFNQAVTAAGGNLGASIRDQAMAIMFELGCIFHSVIIGITFGVNTSDMVLARALIIALFFHQLLEGVALGTFIANARIKQLKGILMIIAYALTCPVGVAIGMAISNTYNPNSITALAVQGVFNGISGGMLLYIGLVMLVAEDFTRREVPGELGSAAAPAAPAPKEEAASTGHSEHGHGSGSLGAPQSTLLFVGCHVAMALGAAFFALLATWA